MSSGGGDEHVVSGTQIPEADSAMQQRADLPRSRRRAKRTRVRAGCAKRFAGTINNGLTEAGFTEYVLVDYLLSRALLLLSALGVRESPPPLGLGHEANAMALANDIGALPGVSSTSSES